MNLSAFENLRTTHPALLLYFYNEQCGVCHSLWPKAEKLVKKKFPEIALYRVNAAESRELAGQLQMLSVPGILLFLEGREYFRANGMISMEELEKKIGRPYGLLFS